MFADVFENFRNRCLENYDLCPSHYLKAPAFKLGFSAMTKVKVDLISDVGMHLCFEKTNERWCFLYFLKDTAWKAMDI